MKLTHLIAPLFALLTLAGCSLDIGDGSQLSGQRCFQDSDCGNGLVCNQRVCVASFGSSSGPDDMGGTSNNPTNNVSNTPNNENNTPINNPINNINNVDPDMGPPCDPGERRCLGAEIVQVCLPDGQILEEVCADGWFCEGGECQPPPDECRDNDGDGYGPGCPRGFDCDDTNPRTNPGMAESCFTSADDNCNGQVNEGCDPNGCCPGGCNDNEFCSQDCVCQDYDPAVCEFQNQPCLFEGDFENGFYCINFNPNSDQPRCWGLCDINAPDPDATCPEPGSVCAFDGGDGQNGICMSPCGTSANGQVTGCDAGLGCINLDVGQGDGICVPTNPENGRGERCDADYFFDCDSGLICLQGFGNNGRCREACRPFYWDGSNTDCDQGHCLAFSADLGVCFADNMSTEGQQCGPPQSACNEDAVGCYDLGAGQECAKICRLDEGDADCDGVADDCTSFDPQQTELGICI